MAQQAPTLADTRRAFRTFILEQVRDDAADLLAHPADLGDVDPDSPLRVLTQGNLQAVLGNVADRALPDFDRSTGEVVTPATVFVHAECPRCGIPVGVMVALTSVLTVDLEGAEISVKAKSKARSHVCGQLTLDAATDEQMTLGVLEGGAGTTVARLLTEDERAGIVLPDGPYPVCGATENVSIDVGDGVLDSEVVCGLVAGHSTTDALGDAWARAHVDLNEEPVAWRYVAWRHVAADDDSAIAGAGDPDGASPDAPVVDDVDDGTDTSTETPEA